MHRLIVVLLPLVAVADETEETGPPEAMPPPAPTAPAHDEFGFPITFDDEIITLSDLEREIGSRLTDPGQIRNARDGVLMRLLSERVALALGVTVEKAELDRLMQRHVDQRGGDAKFYEWLAQRGDTPGRFREQQRQEMLQRKLAQVFTFGHSRDGKTLLPWRIHPTPRDLDRAWRNDAARRKAGVQVRRLELLVDLTEDERNEVTRNQVMGEMSPEEVEAWTKRKLAGRLEKVMADLNGGSPFERVAREQGADIGAQKVNWVEIPKEVSDPALKFLEQAKDETFSKPIPVAGGGYRVVYLLERRKPNPRGIRDPSVATEYDRRIRDLRGRKWESYLRLKALDRATVRPPRVAAEIRKVVVTELKVAEEGLNALGLR